MRADLTLDRIPIDSLAKLPTDKIAGTLSGNLSLSADAAKLHNIQALRGEGKLTSDGLKVYGLSLERITTLVALKDGQLTLTEMTGDLEGAPVIESPRTRRNQK